MSGILYVVGTPLGNLGDISVRAAEVLGSVDLVAAEDTRRSRILLQHIGTKPRVLSYHQHSPRSRVEQILDVLAGGGGVGLVTDAGTPGISDPGGKLVAAARARGFDVVAVPGPSSVVAALSISGLPADRFTFLGFPPRKGKDRTELFETALKSPWTTVFFEAPQRLVGLLTDLAKICGQERSAAVTRELTKLHEEVRAGTLGELAVHYSDTPPKGEITLVIAGSPKETPAVDQEQVAEMAKTLLDQGLTRRDVAQRIAEELKVPRNEAYRMVNEI